MNLPQVVLLLVTDQFRYDAFNPTVTPNLYHKLSLAANATTFTNAYTSTPVCTPARASLLTGKSPWAHGMLGYGFTVNCEKYPTTLPFVLKDMLDYQTLAVGKQHFGVDSKTKSYYVDHGFDDLKIYDALTHQPYDDDYLDFFHALHPDVHYPISVTCDAQTHNEWIACPYGLRNESQHPTPWTTRQALQYLNDFDFKNISSKLLLKVSYHRPHSPYDPPHRLLAKHLARPVPERFVNNTSWDRAFLNTTAMPRAAWYGDPGSVAARHSRAGYLASCEFVDEGVGELLDWLQEHNLFDSSLIVWTTDHGDMNGDHNLWRKGYPWEGSSHVNLIIKQPSIESDNHDKDDYDRSAGVKADPKHAWQQVRQQVQSDAIVETRDIAVTLYDFLGVFENVQHRDPLVDGKSLLPILNNESNKVRRWLDLELSRSFHDDIRDIHWNAIVGIYENANANNDFSDGKGKQQECSVWKYIFHVLQGDEQLFCLAKDRHETHNLANHDEYQAVLKHWRSTMISQFMKEQRGHRWVKNNTLVSGRPPIVFASNFPCKGETLGSENALK